MKLYELLRCGQERLAAAGVPDADVDSELLWLYVSGMDKAGLLLAKQSEVEVPLCDRYMAVIDERCTRKPLQYITGTQDFMGYEFFTAEGVLIPRMDTETLVDAALKLAKRYEDRNYRQMESTGEDASHADGDGRQSALRIDDDGLRSISVLDMCCGSGCIGISFGKLCRTARVTLADISDLALELTHRNIAKLCTDDYDRERFSVVRSDLFENIEGRFDMILSNPPYIRSSVIDTLMPEVCDYEPHLALDGKDDGLYFYRRIAAEAVKYIKEDGYVVFEIGNDQAEDVRDILVDLHYEDIRVVRDLSGNDRIVTARIGQRI